jgi:hypothetical protein
VVSKNYFDTKADASKTHVLHENVVGYAAMDDYLIAAGVRCFVHGDVL